MSDLIERINKLTDQQKVLLAKRIDAENNASTIENHKLNQKIVAYLTADTTINHKSLREALKGILPEYMIPSKFVQIDELPKLPNGKIDLNSLKLPSVDESSISQKDVVTAKSKTEKQLISIWEDVLGFQPIGRHDNFFEIGGDSILSIQIVSKARQKEIFLAPNQIFEHQTISELALFAKTENKNIDDENIVGTVPLLPIQHWFFEEHKNAPDHWNQAMMFDNPENLDSDIMQKSIEYLIEYHPALRLQFEQIEGFWNASVFQTKEVKVFEVIDLTDVATENLESKIEAKSIDLQSNFNLSTSALFQVAIFKCRQGNQNKLFFFAHHLLIDNISWQILVSDLELIYTELSKNEEITLPRKTTSYTKWGSQLRELSKSDEFDIETEFWNEQVDSEPIPTDFKYKSPVIEESVKTINLEIDSVTTENLLRNSNYTYKTKTEELLIVSLHLAFVKWSNMKNLCLGLEKHGRNYSKNDLDFSHSIGWFTTYFPVLLKIEDETNLKSSIISNKEKLRSVPNEGIGFGVLRYLKKFEGLTQTPQVIFNFLGSQKPFNSEVLGKGKFVSEGTRSPISERYHLLEINAFIEENKLILKFGFSEKQYRQDKIHDLVQHFESELRKIIEHCSIQESSVYSPSDFPEADLNQDDLDNLLNQIS